MKQENKINLLESNNQGDEAEDKKSDELVIKEILQKENDEKNEANKDKDQSKKGIAKNEINDKRDDEAKELISKEEKEEKKRLVGIIDRLKEDLDSEEYENLDQIYEQYLNNEDISKRNIKPGTTRKALIVMFYFIAPAFSIINLLGVFQSISIMKIIFQVIKNAVYNYYISITTDPKEIEKYSINLFRENYEFYHMLDNDTKKESFDFNLMMLMAFLGDILLKSRGFRISVSVFAVFNIISMFLILNFSFENYNHDYNTYSLFQFIYLLICWLLLFVGVGASALLSQQIIIDSNYKYEKYIVKLNEESKKEWERIKKIMDKRKPKKEKEIENKETNNQDELIEIKETDENFIDEKNENEKENDEIKSVKTEELSSKINIDKDDKDDLLFKKSNSSEMNVKEIAKDLKSFGKDSQKLLRANTLIPVDILNESKSQKKPRRKKKKSIKEVNPDENKKNKFNSFFMICITTIIGYFLKYLSNLFIFDNIEVREINNIQKAQSIINDGNDEINCSLNYECFEQFFNNTNLTVSNGPLFNSLVNWFLDNDKFSMYSILIIYASSVILSIILYSIFVCIFTKNEKQKNEIGNTYRVCQICGYTIYSENIVLNLNPPCCECCKLLCITCGGCVTMTTCSLCCCLSEEEKNDFDNCFCCCECCQKNDNTYKKNTEFFCYCYQAKRKQNWFNKFITSEIQKKIFPYMLEYFFCNL